MDGKLVRDPIHNYINVTTIEQPIIDGKDFQRLRFVYQNSTAYLTYPSNTNTRFLHSLGVMHLCGKFFSSAMENSDTETLDKFLEAADLIVSKQMSQLMLGEERAPLISFWEQSLGNACHFAHHPFHGDRKDEKALNSDSLFLINTLWQAVRIVGLCHDLGHFPMSHLFENVHEMHAGNNDSAAMEAIERKKAYTDLLASDLKIETERMKNIPLHELRGLVLFVKVISSNDDYTRLVHSIARSVLIYDPDYHQGEYDGTNVYRCLHRLVAGELDADRLDYCMRDPQQSGFEHDAIDAQRIINNFTLYEKDGHFKILPTDKALSAIETFFHHRFFVYKYVIYHHNVSRFNGILEEILSFIFSISDESQPEYAPVLDIIDRFKFVCKAPVDPSTQPLHRYLPDEYSHIYEDAWLRTMLTELHACCESPASTDGHKLIELKDLLNTFLYRQTKNTHSAWKRDTDFNDSYEKISKIIGVDASVIASAHPFTWNPGTKNILDASFKKLKVDLKEIGVTLITSLSAHKIFSSKTDKQLELLCSNRLCAAMDASPYLASLKSVAEKTPGLHVSFVSNDIKGKEGLLEKCDELLHSCLAAYITEIFKVDPDYRYKLRECNKRMKKSDRRIGEGTVRDQCRRSGKDRRAAVANHEPKEICHVY